MQNTITFIKNKSRNSQSTHLEELADPFSPFQLKVRNEWRRCHVLIKLKLGCFVDVCEFYDSFVHYECIPVRLFDNLRRFSVCRAFVPAKFIIDAH